MWLLLLFLNLCFASHTPYNNVTTSSNGPLPRGTWAAAALSENTFVTFGGVIDDLRTQLHTFFNDLWLFNYSASDNSGVWTELHPSGPIPSARGFHSMDTVVDSNGNKHACVFGGSRYTAFGAVIVLDTFYCYNVTANSWNDFTSLGGPSPRSGALARAVNNSLYVFSGVTQTLQTLNDLWRFDIDALTWTQLNPSNPPLPNRHIPVGGIIKPMGEGLKLVIYGGETVNLVMFSTPNDTWEYDISNNSWSFVTNQAPSPPINYCCSAIRDNLRKMLIFGGDQPGTKAGCPLPENPSNVSWDYDVSSKSWSFRNVTGQKPPQIKRHTCVELQNFMFVLGGWGVECANNMFTAQPYNMQVYNIHI